MSSTRHYPPKTSQLLTNYSFTTRSLALSLALFLPLFCPFRQGEGRFATLAFKTHAFQAKHRIIASCARVFDSLNRCLAVFEQFLLEGI
jgi:hypothetical protein